MFTNGKQSRVKHVLTGVIIAILATTAGIWAARAVLEQKSAMNELDATRFPAPREIQPFELIDHNNAVFDNNALRQRWSFLFFGYTHCPDVCPTTLSVLNSVAQQLQDLDEDIRFIFVSVDPERDTTEQLARYVKYFNGDFVGVTGTPEGIEQLTKPLGILHMRVADGDNAGAYLVDHTASVLLFDPDGRYHAVFGAPLSADTVASDFEKDAEGLSMNNWLYRIPVMLLLLIGAVSAGATLTVSEPWIREAPPAARVMAGYLTITNGTDRPVSVTAVSSPDFEMAEIHRTVVEEGVARMLPVSQLEIPANSQIKLEPGGLHMMLIEPQRPLQEGATVTLTIHDSRGSNVTVTAPVIRKTAEDHSHHH